MDNLHIYVAVGLSTLIILASMIVSLVHISGLRVDMRIQFSGIREDLSELRADVKTLRSDIQLISRDVRLLTSEISEFLARS